MDCFNGKWKLVKVDNFEAYLDAIGVPAEIKTKAVGGLSPENDITQELSVTADSITVKSVTPMWQREHTSKFGECFKEPTLDGSEMTVAISSEGGKLVEKQTGNFTSNNVREIVGGNMIYSLTVNGVTTVRTYQKV